MKATKGACKLQIPKSRPGPPNKIRLHFKTYALAKRFCFTSKRFSFLVTQLKTSANFHLHLTTHLGTPKTSLFSTVFLPLILDNLPFKTSQSFLSNQSKLVVLMVVHKIQNNSILFGPELSEAPARARPL